MRVKDRLIAPYARLPRIKGAWALQATSVVVGLPVAMFSLATLVIMALRPYSYALALLSAATVAPIEISTVAAADRHGHHALAGLFLALGAVG